MESFGQTANRPEYRNDYNNAKQATAQQFNDAMPASPNETVSGITEEAISGMNRLCSELQAIADRITGPLPSPPMGAIQGGLSKEPCIMDRSRVLRGLVYHANELTGRIAQNLL
jgi:hypothetical protein